MAEPGARRRLFLRPISMLLLNLLFGFGLVLADRRLRFDETHEHLLPSGYLAKVRNFLWQSDKAGDYQHVWPELEFGWQIVVGSIVGFLGAAFGSVGGVGGGGIFVPMLSLIVGFDAKSSTAISKCMIMGAAASTVYYNLRLRHPTLDMPIIDYDLALLIQPMLMLGISIGVAFNVIFADWMVTVLLIVLFVDNGGGDNSYRPLPSGPQKNTNAGEVTIVENVCWKELGLLVFVWVAFLILQIVKNSMGTCSVNYWILNLLQIPVSLGVSGYEAVSLYKGHRVIASKADQGTHLKVHQLVIYCSCGILAGVVGGLLGLGGGFIMGPLFLELGVPPQVSWDFPHQLISVSSATATFAMTFSSSMSVVEYYLLHRFPVPYAVYFFAVATVAAFVGQHVVRKLIIILGRSSLIIFILAFTIFVSAITLASSTFVSANQQEQQSALTTNGSDYHHVWPEMGIGWRMVVASVIGFLGAAFGSVGGVGGGGIFVPMLTLIIGFDPKSATAISKCMITGAAVATVVYNLKLRHPSLDLPIVEYDLVLLIQPVLLLGISIGVTFNVIFPDWMITVLLITLLLGGDEEYHKPLLGESANLTPKKREVTVIENIRWKELGLVTFVWLAYLALQISKIPVSGSVFLYQAIGLYKGTKKIASKGEEAMNLKLKQLALFSICGLFAGIVGGMLGLGGGFVMGNKCNSNTGNGILSIHVSGRILPSPSLPCSLRVDSCSLRRTVFDKCGGGMVRESITHHICGIGITNLVQKIEKGEYMGFENLCQFQP
ncbi:Sulfite exporter TauE/SafE family protein 3 [Linum perenne]